MAKTKEITPDEVIAAWGLNYKLGTAVALIHKSTQEGGSVEDVNKAAEHLTSHAEAVSSEELREKWRTNKKKVRSRKPRVAKEETPDAEGEKE